MAWGTRLLVDGAVAASVAATAALLPAALRGDGQRDRGRTERSHGGGALPPAAPRRPGPGTALLAVTGLIFLNQVLCTLYVLRVHDGDPSFITRHLPPGWFDMADAEVLTRLAAHVPAPELLAPSVLRIPAVLELPFVLLAVLTALRWLDPGLYRRGAGTPLLWAASVSYTFVFCVVEWDLRNPYTTDDLVLRCVSAVLTPPLLAALARRDTASPRSRPCAADLLLFLGSLAALGVLVLVVYDTALLYNLGRVDERWPLAAAALAVLAACRCAARRRTERRAAPAGGAVAVLGHGVWWFLAVSWVPALAVRYGVVFGTTAVAVLAGGAMLVTAAVAALRTTAAEAIRTGTPVRRPALAARLTAAALAGTAAACAAALPLTDLFYEAALFAATVAFLLTALAVCACADRVAARFSRVPPTPSTCPDRAAA